MSSGVGSSFQHGSGAPAEGGPPTPNVEAVPMTVHQQHAEDLAQAVQHTIFSDGEQSDDGQGSSAGNTAPPPATASGTAVTTAPAAPLTTAATANPLAEAAAAATSSNQPINTSTEASPKEVDSVFHRDVAERLRATDEAVKHLMGSMEVLMRRLDAMAPGPAASAACPPPGILSPEPTPAPSPAMPAYPEREDRRQRLVERKGFAKLAEFDSTPEKFEMWIFKMRGLLQQEPGFRAILEWIHRHATVEEDDEGRRPTTLLGDVAMLGTGFGAQFGDPHAYSPEIPAHLRTGKSAPLVLKEGEPPVTRWDDERLEWLGDNLYEVLQSNLSGAHLTYMMRNLEPITPQAARGFEAWFKLVREYQGNTGPRLLRLVKAIFSPARVRLDQVAGAVEAWEHHVQNFELAGQRLGPVLKTFGLMQLLPADLADDLVKMRQQLTNYAKVRMWVTDQVQIRARAPKAEVNSVDQGTEGDGEVYKPQEPEEVCGLGKAGGKDRRKGAISGTCWHCGKVGHMAIHCYSNPARVPLPSGKDGKGGGKGASQNPGGKGTGGKSQGKGGKGPGQAWLWAAKGGAKGAFSLDPTFANAIASLGKGATPSADWLGPQVEAFHIEPDTGSTNGLAPKMNVPSRDGAAAVSSAAATVLPAASSASAALPQHPPITTSNRFSVFTSADDECQSGPVLSGATIPDPPPSMAAHLRSKEVSRKMPRVSRKAWTSVKPDPEDLDSAAEWITVGAQEHKQKATGKRGNPRTAGATPMWAGVKSDFCRCKSSSCSHTPALEPIFVEQPLSIPLDADEGASPEMLSVAWKREQEGWTCFRAVPDTGAQVSVGPADMAQGYAIRETPASRSGRGFTSASKHSIPNIGELAVPMQSPEGHWTAQRWQMAPEGSVARPLLSIGEECDSGNIVMFGPKGGTIYNQHNHTARHFPRLENGAYEIEMWLPPKSLVDNAIAQHFMGQGM